MARIVHLANMYSPVSGGLRTAVQALGETYLALGHDFVIIVPGKKLVRTRTAYGIKYEFLVAIGSLPALNKSSAYCLNSNQRLSRFQIALLCYCLQDGRDATCFQQHYLPTNE
jgi:hypothetical protein